MANSALIIAESGSGKSTSIETLNPETTFIINIASKALPFRGWRKLYEPYNSKENKGNIVSTADPKIILQVMELVDTKMPHITTLVLDDWQFMAAFEYMNKSHETGLN